MRQVQELETRIAVLGARLEAVHASKLLSDAELYTLEDVIADYIDCKSATVSASSEEIAAATDRALRLAGLSEGLPKDGAFVRQARRKVIG